MGKVIWTFGDNKNERNKFYHYKSPIFKKDIDKKTGEKNYKCFIDYVYNGYKVNPLHKTLPKTSSYVKSYDGKTKWMYFFIENDDLLEKYILIGIKSALIYKKRIWLQACLQ